MSYLVTRPDLLWPLVLLVIVVGVLLTGLSYGLRVGLFTILFSALDRWNATPSRLERWRAQLRQVDETIVGFARRYPSHLFISWGLHFLGWALGTLEVLAIFYAVGIPISVREALAIEALASVVKALAFCKMGGMFCC